MGRQRPPLTRARCRRRGSRRAAAALILLTVPALAATANSALPPRWITSWASAQQVPEPRNALAPADLRDATLRQIVHVSAGGTRIRIRISNAFGTAPLPVSSTHVARAPAPKTAAIVAGTDHVVLFDGSPSVTIPAGADRWSDPVDIALPPLSDIAVSLHFAAAPDRQTSHQGAGATSYLAAGDQTGAAMLAGARPVDHWYGLAGIAVEHGSATVAMLGDSITDGYGSTVDGNDRWPDILAARLQGDPGTRGIGVANLGIGGNRLLRDGTGPNALARFDRDILSQPGVRVLLLLEGINDLGTLTRDHPAAAADHAATVAAMIGAYRQIVARGRAAGLRVLGGTLTPDGGSDYYHPDAQAEADRRAINRWICEPGHFDGVIDFDAALRDPAAPDRLQPRYDSGDHLHPSAAGYRAMAAAIPIGLLR